MTYEFITDRFEAEKLAEDIFVGDDKPIVHMDYADLCTLRRITTLKYAMAIKVSNLDDEAIKEILKAIKTLSIPYRELKTCLVHIRVNESEQLSTAKNLDDFIQQIQNLKVGECSEDKLGCVYVVTSNPSIPLGELHVNLVFAVCKTEEDKLEDEKYEQMIMEYRKFKFPITGDEF